MAHYLCPDCKTKSEKVASRAEAASLLEIHRRYFCGLGRTARAGRRVGRR
ncbi:hypothetical protein [Pseudofrankia inefficax]|uniref:Uncharacterized protein n=1 Tax=Pseudofrankia inefficax (strain DSM 45817 / CECT 9037 / DDB 130130 / EuI1c) TaxID=298654 RepID=E3J729_PSEI1|nr:hypothetical protein [Pseudofrankia inefficax]ADP84393.1 hypothetical protein FraEuI1c_6412 [Pseudofrankia inefficax]